VLDCRGTHASVNDTEVYENRYRYELNGIVYSGLSYAEGRCLEGEPATIEYLKDQPEFSRVQGMRRERFGPWALLIAVIPGIGLVIVMVCLRTGATRVRLLREGIAVQGRFAGKWATNTEINDRRVYRVAIDYKAHDGAVHSTVVRSTNPERFEREVQEAVLYDPQRLDRATTIDGLPGGLKLDEFGQFQAGGSWWSLVPPVLSLALNAWFIGSKLSGS
jgi:hypothetical protein